MQRAPATVLARPLEPRNKGQDSFPGNSFVPTGKAIHRIRDGGEIPRRAPALNYATKRPGPVRPHRNDVGRPKVRFDGARDLPRPDPASRSALAPGHDDR